MDGTQRLVWDNGVSIDKEKNCVPIEIYVKEEYNETYEYILRCCIEESLRCPFPFWTNTLVPM